MCDRRRKALGEEGKEIMIGVKNKGTPPFCFCFFLSLPSPSCACHAARAKEGSLGIFEWGCAAGTLEHLAYTTDSSAEAWYPIPDKTRQTPLPPHPRVAVHQELLRSLAQFS